MSKMAIPFIQVQRCLYTSWYLPTVINHFISYILCNATHYKEWEQYNIVNCHSSICTEKMTSLPIHSITMELCKTLIQLSQESIPA